MKNKLLTAILAGAVLTFGWAMVSESAVNDISSEIIRLHILANSNSQEDINLKLKVRDAVLKEANIKSYGSIDLEKIKNICFDEIKRNGFYYDVKVEMGTFYFPTKSYESIMLPAGDYKAVRILIGEAKGENWWCVMYPPLCFDGTSDGKLSQEKLDQLKRGMKSDNYSMISGEKITLKPSFKIVELWQELKQMM